MKVHFEDFRMAKNVTAHCCPTNIHITQPVRERDQRSTILISMSTHRFHHYHSSMKIIASIILKEKSNLDFKVPNNSTCSSTPAMYFSHQVTLNIKKKKNHCLEFILSPASNLQL